VDRSHRLLVASALKTRRTVRREPFASRYGILLLEVVGLSCSS